MGEGKGNDFGAEVLVVISYYDRRPLRNLHSLLKSMSRYNAGMLFDVHLVINSTSDHEIESPQYPFDIEITYRPNIGMNIGAWDAGWRVKNKYKYFLFLQDECYVVQDGWLKSFVQAASQDSIGLIGESLNETWSKSWGQLRTEQRHVQMPEHFVDGLSENRVDVYLHFFRKYAIDPGLSGVHIRSLVWFFRRDVLEAIDGFPIGSNYGECIASEIAVSKKVEAAGFKVAQLKTEPFSFIRHVEWNQDLPGGNFSHKAVLLNRIKKLEEENMELRRLHSNTNDTTINIRLEKIWSHLKKNMSSSKLLNRICK